MRYQYNLGPHQKIYLDNPAPNTVITLASSGPGQQQQSGTQILTGVWTEVPRAVQVGDGVLIRCVTAQGAFIWQVQGTQILSDNAAQWPDERAVPLQPTEVGSAMGTMAPMAPMGPMKMGNMEMSASPMTMRMGEMTLSMDNTNVSNAKKFCPQCGTAVDPSDRFCGSCGHQLR
ncbi:zinc ribbon domain-containing protein [Nodosilinea nodulosa]|uniref:zinc ribbon domain-containing protein n=1 Tax=Nodosilinea nodulosa TaxID=416001 RepID=UPI00031E0271|nr:zinc ribbon domain-containing protein [Nodosilinea nodulosa]